jgi:protein-tyrosine phosphatase
MQHISVLFVCMGNICRSPTAHGIFEHLVEQAGLSDKITVDSAGTISYHAGNPPDMRSMQTAHEFGIDLSDQRSRPVNQTDFYTFDYIIGMDNDNLRNLLAMCPEEHQSKVTLLLEQHPDVELVEVPDPYYGGGQGFEKVFKMCELACQNLLETIKQNHQL